ncbi:hypothetical protein HFD88_001004 [Aspergillus terreus]|nr:hypothetical protein HFD88_001004 [Aspergillus terreus]
MANLSGLSIRSRTTLASLRRFGFQTTQQAKPTESSKTPIDASVAENWSIRPELLSLFQETLQTELGAQHLSYPNSHHGDTKTLQALCTFFNRYFRPHLQVKDSHIALASGSANCLAGLLYHICEPGDGVLIPAPYWNGFDFHFGVRAQVNPVAAPIRDLHDAFNPDGLLESLTAAFDTSPYPIRALVLTYPGNPLGQCCSAEALRRCAKFCHDRGLHLICDEVYALSYFGAADSEATPFQSIVSFDLNAMGKKKMEPTLKILGASLQEALSQLTGPLNEERLAALHDHSEGRLVDANLGEAAAYTIDLLHQVEQLLEPSSLVLADHFLGYLNTKCLCAAVEFHIPDLLVGGPKSVSQLAQLSGARAHRLGQVLRLLRNNGIFQYDTENATYSNNPTSSMLRSDHWTQWHNWVDLYGNEFYDMARGIPASLKQGTTRTPAQINFNTDQCMFDYFTAQGWLPRLHRTLGGGATAQAPGILADYPWEDFGDGPFLDIGGGEGALIALILRRHTRTKAALLDTPRVIEHARTLFLSPDGKYADVGDRVQEVGLIAGDFLESVPSFEFYTMKWCLHDWDDVKTAKVLSNIREAIRVTPESRLVVLESILADGRSCRLSRYGDLTMMVSADGQERTEAEWRTLAGRTGWEIRTIRKLRGAWPSDETSYINYIKPLILAHELEIPHVLSVIDTKDEWFYRIHPERMVPSLKDQDPETKAEVIVFESTACLQYLADRFDDGTWTGRNAAERGSVLSWTAYQTAALGPTAKYWLYFLRGYPTRQNPVQLPRTIQKLHENCLRQWDILEKRLARDGQEYIALKDRPTIADLSYFPFSMPWMFQFLGVDIKDWPSIERWSQRMLARPAVQAVMEMGPQIGH